MAEKDWVLLAAELCFVSTLFLLTLARVFTLFNIKMSIDKGNQQLNF
jgi:hypothetical protein